MNLVYILGKGSKWNDNELKYSLRSVAMHGRNVSKVFIVGECPEWLQNVTHIPADDPHTVKADNAWHKVAAFCKQTSLPFVLMNDDFFLLKETDFDALPMYTDGSIEELLARYKRVSVYKQCLQNTLVVLQKAKKPTRNYALHVPITIQPNKLLQLYQQYGTKSGLSVRNMYGNVPYEGEAVQIADVKLSKGCVNKEEIIKQLRNAPFFSIGDEFLNGVGAGFLVTQYPEKCKYEK
jgi:hypothetical protein